MYTDIQSSQTFENFTLIHFDPDWQELINEYVETTGGEPSDIIEPADGFHPNQLGNMLLAEKMWEFIEGTYPDALGGVNPNNDKIAQLFGDQGGH